MATRENPHLPGDLPAEPQPTVEEKRWQDLLAYGRETGRASGYSEDDVPEIVKKRRRLNAGRP